MFTMLFSLQLKAGRLSVIEINSSVNQLYFARINCYRSIFAARPVHRFAKTLYDAAAVKKRLLCVDQNDVEF